MMKNLFLLVSLGLACVSGASAENHPPVTKFPFMSHAEFESRRKEIRKNGVDNKAAFAGYDYEGKMSVSLKRLRERILGNVDVPESKRFIKETLQPISTSEQLAALIDDLEKNYDSTSPEKKLDTDAKLIALQLVRLKPFRGFIFRLVPIAEKTKIVHSILLTRVMKLATRMSLYFPTSQASAVFKYLTEPYDNVVQYQPGEEKKFQSDVYHYAYDAAKKSAERLMKLDLKTPVVVDNMMLYNIGTTDADGPNFSEDATFVDATARYSLFGENERYSLLGLKHRGMIRLLTFVAYDMTGFLTLAKELGKLSGVDAGGIFGGREIDGTPTAESVEVMNRPMFANLFRLNAEFGKEAMAFAFDHTREMVYNLSLGWERGQKSKGTDDQNSFLNPMVVTAFDRTIGDALPTWERMVSEGTVELKSRRSSEVADVNLRDFYVKPIDDLKRLMPVDFYQKTDDKFSAKDGFIYKKIKVGSFPATVRYRHYLAGSPRDWSLQAYSNIYPNLKDSKSVGHYQRIMKQSWGGRLVPNVIDWLID